MRQQRITQGMVWAILGVFLTIVFVAACIGCSIWAGSGGESRVEQIAHLAHSCPTGTVPKINFEGGKAEESGHITGFTCVERQ